MQLEPLLQTHFHSAVFKLHCRVCMCCLAAAKRAASRAEPSRHNRPNQTRQAVARSLITMPAAAANQVHSIS